MLQLAEWHTAVLIVVDSPHPKCTAQLSDPNFSAEKPRLLSVDMQQNSQPHTTRTYF